MSKIENLALVLRRLRMKIISCSVLGLACAIQPAFTQNVVQQDTINQLPDSNFQYLNSMEYAFMMHEETSWMIKASVIILNEYTNVNPFKVAFERRITNSFTLNMAFDNYMDFPADYPYMYTIHGSIESRWYYRQNKRMKKYNLSRNMSDNYIALGFGYTQSFVPNSEYPDILVDKYLSLYAKLGLQRRFLKPGHTDMGIMVGIMNAMNGEFKPSLVLNSYVEIGLCFTRDKYKLDQEKLCPFMRCYEADRFVFKTNLSDILNVGLYSNSKWINFSPHIAFERKIGSSAFSINSELDALAGYSETVSDAHYYDKYWQAGLILEGRWYYNLMNRIMAGKSGNGLSANYIAIGGSYYYIEDTRYDITGKLSPQLHIATGFQRLISKHMYFDLQLGINYYFEPDRHNTHYDPRARLALGYRF